MLDFGSTFQQVHQREALLLGALPEINPLDAAAVDDGRLLTLMQILVAVNVAQGDVVKWCLGQHGQGYFRLIGQVADLIGAEFSVGNREVAHQNRRQIGVAGSGQCVDARRVAVHDELRCPLDALVFVLLSGQDEALDKVRHGGDLDARPALRLDDRPVRVVEDAQPLAGQFTEDLDGVGPALRVRDVVIPRQHDDGNARLGQLGKALGELALVGLVRVARLVGVSGEDGQFDSGLQSDGDGFRQGIAEVHKPRGQAGLWVEASVVLDAEVDITKMHEADGFGHGVSHTIQGGHGLKPRALVG